MEIKKSEKADLEKRRGLFLQLGFILSLSVILIAFEWTSSTGKISELELLQDEEVEEEIVPITRQEQNQPPPPPPPPQVTEVLNIVDDDVELEDELIIEDMEADQNTEIEIVEFEEEEEEEEAEVFFIVEEMPEFMGGDQNEFRKFIQQNLKYPQIAAENGISGRVFVYFVVNEKGEVTNARVVRGVDPSLDKEALRVVMSSPKWNPGRQRGKPVRVAFTFPIVFVLQ
ncbi:MAG: energy transducer TonB [Bacteroidales bacterium]|nr:energy transducer TonB [Bacteroidales bacterium]